MFNTIFIATDSCKSFNMGIPWRKIIIAYGPVNGEAITCRGFEFKSTPTLRLPCPHQRFAAHLVTTYPVERFFLHIRMFFIFYEKMLGSFIECIAFTYYRIFFLNG